MENETNLIQHSEIKFSTNFGANEIRFDRNGDIFIKGKLVTNDIEIVEGFRQFLREAGCLKKDNQEVKP